MRLSRRSLLRVTAAVAGAVATVAAVAGPAHADQLEDGDDGSESALFAGDSSDEAAEDDEADEDADDRPATRRASHADSESDRPGKALHTGHLVADRAERATGNRASAERGRENRSARRDSDDGGSPEEPRTVKKTRQHKHEGVYGLDKDPGSLASDNLDGRTDPPGFYYPGIGTIEAPGIATR